MFDFVWCFLAALVSFVAAEALHSARQEARYGEPLAALFHAFGALEFTAIAAVMLAVLAVF